MLKKREMIIIKWRWVARFDLGEERQKGIWIFIKEKLKNLRWIEFRRFMWNRVSQAGDKDKFTEQDLYSLDF